MAGISEALLTRVLTGMGVNVPELVRLFDMIGVEIRDLRNERAAFKRASADVVNEFRVKLAMMDGRLERLENALLAAGGHGEPLYPSNGAIVHVGHNEPGPQPSHDYSGQPSGGHDGG